MHRTKVDSTIYFFFRINRTRKMTVMLPFILTGERSWNKYLFRHNILNLSPMKTKLSKNNRREFLKITGMTGLGILSAPPWKAFGTPTIQSNFYQANSAMNLDQNSVSLIGQYGPWAVSLTEGKLPSLSFRNKEFTNINAWRKQARCRCNHRFDQSSRGHASQYSARAEYFRHTNGIAHQRHHRICLPQHPRRYARDGWGA